MKDMEEDLLKCLKDVSESRPESLVAFMPLVLDKLLLLMVKPPTVAGRIEQRPTLVDFCSI
jgi:hypothetical protein